MGIWNWGKGKKKPQISTIIEVDTDVVSCNGKGEHPKVWYTVPEEGFVQCGYCDIMFMRKTELSEVEKMDRYYNGSTFTKNGLDNDF